MYLFCLSSLSLNIEQLSNKDVIKCIGTKISARTRPTDASAPVSDLTAATTESLRFKRGCEGGHRVSCQKWTLFFVD